MTHIHTIETRMTNAQASLRPHLGSLLTRLAVGYGVPFLGATLLATLGAVVLANTVTFLPQSTVSTLTFALNVLLIYFGWRYLERRTHATALFVLYSNASRERRTLKRLIAEAQAGNQSAQDDLAKQASTYESACEMFIRAIQSA